jgi:hypothetical protein
MTFSWIIAKQRAITIKVQRAKQSAKNSDNIDFTLEHPDESRDANQNQYTKLIKRVTLEMDKRQKLSQQRRDKLLGN